MTEHKHAEVLRAIADGRQSEVEWQHLTCGNDCWHPYDRDHVNPLTDLTIRWRVKPKPDYKKYVAFDVFDHLYNTKMNDWKYNLEITIDGETNEPKSVELIK